MFMFLTLMAYTNSQSTEDIGDRPQPGKGRPETHIVALNQAPGKVFQTLLEHMLSIQRSFESRSDVRPRKSTQREDKFRQDHALVKDASGK